MYQSCPPWPALCFFLCVLFLPQLILETPINGLLRLARAYLSPSNTYIHRDMTYHFHVLYASRLSFFVLFWPLTSHIYTKPTNSTIRFPTFPTCVSRPFFSLRLLAHTLLYLLTYGLSLSLLCTQILGRDIQ